MGSTFKVLIGDPTPFERSTFKAIEVFWGGSLPDDYCRFLEKYNGADVSECIFDVGEDNDGGFNKFFLANEVIGIASSIEDLPANAIPLAESEGGNLVFLSLLRGGGVFFWDHEVPDAPTRLANSIDEFIRLLRPFDVDSNSLDPDDILAVWVDPSFKPKFD